MSLQISGVQMGTLTGGPSSIALSDLSDVSIVSPVTAEYLRYNSGISEWQNVAIDSDVYDYLNTNLTSSNGVDLTFVPGPKTIDVSLNLTASGDATGSVSSGNLGLTLTTVNSNIGTYGSGILIPVVTVNAKGLITSVSTTSFSGTSPLATSLAGGSAGTVVYQSAANITAFLPVGATSQVLISGASAPSWTNTPTLTGTNFTGIPNGALTNSSLTLGSTSMALGSTTSTVVGLTSVTSTTFIGALTGNASTATNLAISRTFSATGDATAAAQLFNGSANVALPMVLATVNSNVGTFASVTVNGKGLVTAATSLSGDITSSGAATTLATVNSNAGQFAVATFNAKGLATAATTLTGDITSSGAATTLATVNSAPQTDTFRKITVNGKGLVTATSAVSASDITTALTYTPVNKNGDTMTGLLVLSADPTNSLGAVTKQYADAIAAGVDIHGACETSTTIASNLGAATYNNGASGVGATLTANANGILGTIGGYASLVVGSRLLVKDQASTLQNGIYIVTSLGSAGTPWVLTRSTDLDGSPTNEVNAGDLTYVQEGTLAGTQWVITSIGTGSPNDYIIIGTNPIVWSQFSGPGTYTSGSGINISTNVISNTGVLSLTTNSGLSTNVAATGAVSITNTGVTSISGTANQITMSAATGAVTASLPVTITGLTSVTSTTFVGALSGNATSATNVAAGLANQIPYQTGAGATSFFSAANYGVHIYGATGVPAAVAGAAGVLQGSASAIPVFTTTPTLTGTNFTGIPNGALINSSVTVNGTSISLGGSGTVTAAAGTLTGTTLNATVVSSSLTSVGILGSLAVSGGVTAGSFSGPLTGAVTGNATTATTLQTARNINGVSFNGSADITVTAAAGTLTGATLAAGVTGSSLTSVGTLASLAVTGAITGTSFNSITGLATIAPLSNGTAAVGISTLAARQDHVHPASMTTLTINTDANISETTTAVITDTATTIDTFAVTTYRSAKYFVQVTDTVGPKYQIVEISVIHDGTTVFKTEYGQVITVSVLGTFDASITSGNLNLQFTATAATTKSVKVYRTALTV